MVGSMVPRLCRNFNSLCAICRPYYARTPKEKGPRRLLATAAPPFGQVATPGQLRRSRIDPKRHGIHHTSDYGLETNRKLVADVASILLLRHFIFRLLLRQWAPTERKCDRAPGSSAERCETLPFGLGVIKSGISGVRVSRFAAFRASSTTLAAQAFSM